MSLWTPYVSDVALDLSKSAVKQERVTPPPLPVAEIPGYPSYQYQHPMGYYQYPVYVPSSQMSPVSAGSTCSYEAPTFSRTGLQSPAEAYPTSPVPIFARHGPQSPVETYPTAPAPVYARPGLLSPEAFQTSPAPAFPRPESPPDSPESKRRSSYMTDADILSTDPNYQAFERNALKVMAEKNGGSLLGNNPRMRRVVRSTNGNADDEYRRQRERNNFAAKQSRDRRKLREVKLALKVAYLKNEVASLRASLNAGVCGKCQTAYRQ